MRRVSILLLCALLVACCTAYRQREPRRFLDLETPPRKANVAERHPTRHRRHTDSEIVDGDRSLPHPLKMPHRLQRRLRHRLRSDPIVPTAALLVHETLIGKLTAIAVPVLENLATTTPISAEDTDHYSFPSFNLSSFTLDSVTASFATPNLVQATFTNVSITVPTTPFYIYEKVFGHKFGCHGTFAAQANNSQLTAEVQLHRSPLNGSLIVTDVQVNAVFGTLNVQPTFDSDVCKIAGKILGFLFGGLDNLLKDLVQHELPAKMANILRNETNKYAGKIPLRLAAEPNVTATGLELVAQLQPSNNTPPTVPIPSFQHVADRDIEAAVTVVSVNTLLALETVAGTFSGTFELPATLNTTTVKKELPGAYTACPGCPLAGQYAATAPPFINVQNQTVAVTVNQLQLTLAAINSSNTQVELLVVSLDLGFAVSNVSVTGPLGDTIYFQLALPTFSATLVQSMIGNIDVAVLAALIQFALNDVILKAFNADFGGITIPAFDGFSVRDVVLALGNGQLGFATNVHVPSSLLKH
jgi:hypothetical protein